MIVYKDLPRTMTRTTYYALHHTYRHLQWMNRDAIDGCLSDLAIYGRALYRIGAEGLLTHLPAGSVSNS